MLYKAVLFLLFLFPLFLHASDKTNKVCVFDPIGKNGEIYPRALDISTDFLALGVNLKLEPFTREEDVVRAFRTKQCQAMVVTGFVAREFNRFSTSIEAPGLIDSYDLFRDVLLTTMSSPKLGQLMKKGHYEVAGVFPIGVAYMYLKDASLNMPEKFKGKSFQVFNTDPLKDSYIKNWGIKPVIADTTNLVLPFRKGQVDASVLPAAVTIPFEVNLSLDEFSGKVIDLPLSYITLQLIIQSDQFPEGFGQRARELSLNHYRKSLQLALDAERVLAPYKLKLHSRIKDIWMNSLQEIRQTGVEMGQYDTRMFKIIKKIRCKRDSFEEGCL